MERTFTTTAPGPVSLDLPVGSALVTVDRTIKTPSIRLHTVDEEGPAVDSIRRASTSTLVGLIVTVPNIGGRAGGVTVISTGGYSSVSIGSGSVIVNGQHISGGQVSNGITAHVTVPPDTTVTFRSDSADLHVTGPLAALNVTTVSGDIEAGMVGNVGVSSTSGDIDIDAVSGQLSASTVSGDVEIGTYSGHGALLSAVSGDLALSATLESSGPLSARTVSGSIRLRGASHLNPQASTVSGRVRS